MGNENTAEEYDETKLCEAELKTLYHLNGPFDLCMNC